MELHRIDFSQKLDLYCGHPGGQYAEAQRRATLEALKSGYKWDHAFNLKIARWSAGIMVGFFAAIAIGGCIFANKAAVLLGSVLAAGFILMEGLGEVGAWRRRKYIERFEAEGGRTKLEEETLRSPFFSACHTVSAGAGDTLNAAWRWNAYVERVKVGSTDRFEDDVAIGRDIQERLSAILELDPLVYRLYRDDRQYRWEIAQTPNKVERPNYVSSERALKRLDLSVAASAEAWLKSLLERHPELVSP